MALPRRTALAAGLVPLTGCTRLVRSDGGAPWRLPDADLRIGFTGDVMLGRGVDRAHRDGRPQAVWGSALEHLRGLDGLLVNLECVLSERGEPWPDKTYHFRARPDWARRALEAAGVDAVTLANNHAMDFGAPALLDTLEHLDAIDVGHTGAGADRDAALEPTVVEAGGLRIAAFGLVDHWQEFAAGADEPGTAFADLDVENDDAVALVDEALQRAERADPDLVVAELHWGYNYETAPQAKHREFGRWLIDRGVDLIHGHSAHILQGVEVYRGRPIVYDAGDFVDDYVDHERYHNKRSYLFELVRDDGAAFLRLVPVQIRDYRVHLADEAVREGLEATLRERSAPFDTTIEREADAPVLRIPLDQ